MVQRERQTANVGDTVEFMRPRPRLRLAQLAITFFVAIFLAGGYAGGIIFPPQPTAQTIVIERGMTAEEIARALKDANIIRSKRLFVWAVYFSGTHDRLGAGTFNFKEPESLVLVIGRLLAEHKEVSLLIREGDTAVEIAQSIDALGLDGKNFLALVQSQKLEGRLFPDTYRFFESASPEEIALVLVSNFEKKTAPLEADFKKSRHAHDEIIMMASIIEREVHISEDRKIISGILWKRFSIGMPLQVDAAPETYEHNGFPKIPISNPGLDAIDAALHPRETPYLYYLSGRDGTTHFAHTFDEHKLNKAKFLR